MHKKTLLVIVGILMSASLVAALLLTLNSAHVKADPLPGLCPQLHSENAQRWTNGREVTIVQPTTGDILTTAHWPTYTVEINVAGMVALEAVSVSVDGGATYHEPTGFLPPYAYDWGLPDEDYEQHLLIARASYSTGEPRVVSNTATVYVDTLPPQGAVITAPSHVETTTFSVSWSASDGSGMTTYDVEYRRDDQISWTSWTSGTSETSKLFTEPLAEGHSYTFRMRAHDRGNNVSNWVYRSVQVGDVYVYLPLTLRQWAWWYQYDQYEPNDTPSQAWGPLEPGQDYDAYIWNEVDRDDYYHVTPPMGASVQITLTNIPDDTDYDLYVYHYDPETAEYIQEDVSNELGTSDEHVIFTAERVKYYIRVAAWVGFSSELPYRLRVTYGVDD